MVATNPDFKGRLYSGYLLLMGPNSRRDIVRHLGERWDEPDWGGILEQICNLSRERYRHGEPILNLFQVERQERGRFMVEPFVLENGITIIYGDGATAKSNVALRWGLEVSLTRGSVLYLDWEDDAATHAERLRAICASVGVADVGAGILYQRRSSRLAESVRDIRRACVEHDVKMVIVDSLGMAAGDPNDSNLVLEAMRACRSLNVAVLVIHHLPKNAIDKSKPFGTVYASNEARLTWLFEKEQEEDADEFTILLTNHKTNRTKLFAKRAMRLRFENVGEELRSLSIRDIDAVNVEAFRPKLALWKHIHAVLNLPKNVPDLVKALALDGRTVSDASVRRALNENRARFENVGSAQAAIWQRTIANESVRGSERPAYAYER